jgi:hypothetical protein
MLAPVQFGAGLMGASVAGHHQQQLAGEVCAVCQSQRVADTKLPNLHDSIPMTCIQDKPSPYHALVDAICRKTWHRLPHCIHPPALACFHRCSSSSCCCRCRCCCSWAPGQPDAGGLLPCACRCASPAASLRRHMVSPATAIVVCCSLPTSVAPCITAVHACCFLRRLLGVSAIC